MKRSNRWLYLVVGTLCMLFAGIIYAWSILKAPLEGAFGWTNSQLALNYTLTMSFFCIGGVVGGALTKRTSPRVTLLLSAVLSCAGFVLSSRLNGAIGMLYLAYGVMCGLGIGMAYNVVIATTGAWFPDRKGMCSGALMMGFGASTLLLGNLAGAMIESASIGWRTTYLALGILIGVVLLITAILIRQPTPEESKALPAPKQAAGGKEDFESRDYTLGEMLRRPTFWRFFLFTIAIAAIGNSVISFARDLAISVGTAQTLATTLVGVLSVCNGLGRIVGGIIFDGMGRKRTMTIASVLALAAPGVLLVSILTRSVPLCVAGLCLTGLAYGFAPTISSAFVSTFYGTKYFAMNFSVANMMLIPASFIATLSNSLVASTGGYVAPSVLLLALAVIGLALNFSIRRP